MSPELLRFLHLLGATVLLGTGAGIAFFMVISSRSRDPRLVAHVAGIVVLADTVFTATAALLQPVTGILLARAVGWSLLEPWILLSLGLYVFTGLFWLPVVWMQVRLRDMARVAAAAGAPLPDAWHRLYRWWFAFGFPAFGAVLGIIWLMLARPALLLFD
ncbi:DUF2269 domain-containing protein [Cereibacter sphaeroides]|uniref:DUF2269 family protein n=1 Tax=Cereibacter sphaeroides TaxID=1063 RepID=UPI001F2B4DA4|nr:DUF2269 domain-containing protein [Cereibacter sphaeroides]MCE6957632.1 DUF2269 domain-containing protein [Cereibacter sphaeroides]MCE6971099.1 DUF2269 domain-containing protein [Cereibacter sphaeroides]